MGAGRRVWVGSRAQHLDFVAQEVIVVLQVLHALVVVYRLEGVPLQLDGCIVGFILRTSVSRMGALARMDSPESARVPISSSGVLRRVGD